MNQTTNQLNQPINSSTSASISHSTIFWKIGILAAVFAFVYFYTIVSFIKTWSGRDDYSHGFLIPFISLYFVWHKRNKLRDIPVEPNLIGGLILISIGGLMLLTGYIGSVVMVQQISVLIVIPGIVLTLLGVNYLKALILPLAYLVFMIPSILDLFIGNVHWPFQLFGATVAEKILNIFKIPVFRQANFLELPNITLEVANACSGVRYLISIIALAIPMAYLTLKNQWKKVLLVIMAAIIGILVNPIRVALIGIWSYSGGGTVHGPYHIFQGFFVSVIGFISLFFLAWILSGIPSFRVCQTSQNIIAGNNTPHLSFGLNIKQINHAWLITIVMLLVLGSFLYLYKPLPIPLKSPLNNFPLIIVDWKSKYLQIKSFPVQVQGADSELNRIYRNSSGREIKLYAGYFESQSQDKELIHYKLDKLYEQAEEIEIPLTSLDNVRVNKAVIKEGFQNSLILYWYNLNGQIITNNYKAKYITALNGLIHRRTNGAIVIVSSNLNHSEEFQKVFDDEVEFVQIIMPVLKSYFPEKN